MLMFSLSIVNAEEAIGQRQDAQLNSSYIISQPCVTCTFMYITVYTKDGKVLENVAMVNNGSSWEYNYTPTTALRHDVNGWGDKNGLNSSFAFWFDVTLSGEPTNIYHILAEIIVILFVMGIIFIIHYNSKKTDFDKWDEKIMNEHKNAGQTMARGILYGLFKNTFIWYYSLGWIIVMILKDIVYRFSSQDIYGYFTLIGNIYSLGFLLVIVFIIGFFATYMRNSIKVLTDNKYGVGGQ